MPSPNMSSNIIVFHCPGCGSKLQVPAKMAGVTGPCPSCSASITAPETSEEPAESPGAAAAPEAMEPKPVTRLKPQPTPSTASPQPGQAKQPGDQAVEASGFKPLSKVKPEAEEITGQQENSASGQVSGAINPEATRPDFSTYKAAQTALYQTGHSTAQRPGWARWMSVLFPLVFLVAACIVILTVLHLTGLFNIADHQRVWVSPKAASPDASTGGSGGPATSAEDAGQPASQTSPPDPESAATELAPDDAPAIATPEPDPSAVAHPETGELTDQASENPQGQEQSPGPAETAPAAGSPTAQQPVATPRAPAPAPTLTAGALANYNLEQFLQAKTLAERKALMSGGTGTAQQPGASCLDDELKPVKSLRLIETVPKGKDLIQYFYSVSFEDPEEDRQRQRIIMQLAERPGIHPPLVNADAFLQHYNKELTRYAGQRGQDDVVTFHCIAEARTSSLSEDLPDELKDNMVRLLIKTHPYNETVFNAYLSKKSPLMAHIGSGKGLPYTRARYCVLSFLWNTTHPGHPYIELKDIVTMSWEK